MNPWQATFFGLKQIPRELTAFEIEAFFTFTGFALSLSCAPPIVCGARVSPVGGHPAPLLPYHHSARDAGLLKSTRLTKAIHIKPMSGETSRE